MERGCGGRRISTMDCEDFDCDHGYLWECDKCPMQKVFEKEKESGS